MIAPRTWLRKRTESRKDREADEVRVQNGFWRKLRRNTGRLPFVDDLVAAYYAAFDPRTPLSAKAILIAALVYFIMPADVVPDVLMGAGFLDDASVLAYACAIVRKHILPRHYDQAHRALAREKTVPVPNGMTHRQEAGV
ncbi:MAG: DUF1232 domain-containing protein [Rhodospirillales bacterium]|nr:DUF1232 domain-containing protein [Rhodospirillales bacterium]